MLIPCPYCGNRGLAEFSYLGDAGPRRPQDPRRPAAEGGEAPGGVEAAFFDYVYMRNNPPGLLHEWWHHRGGCGAYLAVERNVTTHEIGRVTPARELAPRESLGRDIGLKETALRENAR